MPTRSLTLHVWVNGDKLNATNLAAYLRTPLIDWAAIVDADLVTEGAHGEKCQLLQQTEEVTMAVAASTDSSITIPANALVIAVPSLVTAQIPTASQVLITGAGDGRVFSTAPLTASHLSDVGTAQGIFYNATAQAIRLVADKTPATATGKIRLAMVYLSLTAPTS